MILSVLSSPALVSGLMVARAKNPVHSVLFPIPVFRDTSVFTFFSNLPLIRKIPNRGKYLLFFFTRLLSCSFTRNNGTRLCLHGRPR